MSLDVLGVDPGSTTGLALWSCESRRIVLTAEVFITDVTHYIRRLLEVHDLIVACERYDITPETVRSTRNDDPLDVRGWLRLTCLDEDVEFHQYSRATTKLLAQDGTLVKLRWYRAGQRHANDASRVVLTHLASHQPSIFKELRGSS